MMMLFYLNTFRFLVDHFGDIITICIFSLYFNGHQLNGSRAMSTRNNLVRILNGYGQINESGANGHFSQKQCLNDIKATKEKIQAMKFNER